MTTATEPKRIIIRDTPTDELLTYLGYLEIQATWGLSKQAAIANRLTRGAITQVLAEREGEKETA